MSTLQQLREGLHDAWDSFHEGWQRFSNRAAGAITRFTPGKITLKADDGGARHELATRSAGWGVLTAEVFDDDDKIIVRLEAPGMEKEDIDLEVLDDILVIRGEKHFERERKEGRYHVTECAYGRFERAIPLPTEVESDKADASYRKGVLRVELPKASSHSKHAIKVDVR